MVRINFMLQEWLKALHALSPPPILPNRGSAALLIIVCILPRGTFCQVVTAGRLQAEVPLGLVVPQVRCLGDAVLVSLRFRTSSSPFDNADPRLQHSVSLIINEFV